MVKKNEIINYVPDFQEKRWVKSAFKSLQSW